MDYLFIDEKNCDCMDIICAPCFNTLAGTDSTIITDLRSNNCALAKQNTELKQDLTKLKHKLTEVISELFYLTRIELGTPRKTNGTKFNLIEFTEHTLSTSDMQF